MGRLRDIGGEIDHPVLQWYHRSPMDTTGVLCGGGGRRRKRRAALVELQHNYCIFSLEYNWCRCDPDSTRIWFRRIRRISSLPNVHYLEFSEGNSPTNIQIGSIFCGSWSMYQNLLEIIITRINGGVFLKAILLYSHHYYQVLESLKQLGLLVLNQKMMYCLYYPLESSTQSFLRW